MLSCFSPTNDRPRRENQIQPAAANTAVYLTAAKRFSSPYTADRGQLTFTTMKADHNIASTFTASPNHPSENPSCRASIFPDSRCHNIAATTRRYARFAHKIATAVISSTILGNLTLTTRMRIAPAPTAIAGITGVLVARDTLANTPLNGSFPSRAIANITRTVPVCTASVHTKIANATSHRKIRPSLAPSTDLTTCGNPPSADANIGSRRSGAARRVNNSTRRPDSPAAPSACRIARGARRRGSCVSSASEPAVSKPYITYDAVSAAAARNGPT